MKDPLVEEGLRALREELPSDESKRATLARLGLGAAPAAEAAAEPPPSRVAGAPELSSTSRWLLAGVLLGVLALVLRRWLL